MYTDFRDQNGNSISAATVIAATKQPVIRHSIAFELFHGDSFSPFFFFDEEDIIKESLVITNSCGGDGIRLGSVNIGMLKVTLKNDKMSRLESPDSLIGGNLSPIYYLAIDENTTASVMSETYYIKEVEQLTEGVRFICYDGMSKLDTPFTETSLSGTPYQILTQAAIACGTRVQSTQAEIEALPNGTRTFTLHSDHDCKTWRDVVSYLVALMGCFATFGRHQYGVAAHPGILVKPFGDKNNPDDTITETQRYSGAKFSIWDTNYSQFTLKVIVSTGKNDSTSTEKVDIAYYDDAVATGGQSIDLGYNPFLQADTPEAGLTQTQKDVLHDLLVRVAKYKYTPLQISLPVGFIYDLGDVLKCTGGLANTAFAGGVKGDAYGCILSMTYTYGREFRIKSMGNSASITGAQSSAGAGIVPGLVNYGGGAASISAVTYTNADAYSIGSSETKIIELKFNSSSSWGLFHAEIHATGEGTATFRYVLNGNTVGFNPVDTLATGSHIINLLLPFTPITGQNTLEVYMEDST